MSNLKLNSAGGGSVTLSVPSTSSARTLTLPDLTDTVAVTNQLGLRNRIINGAMMIDQRNAGAAVTAANVYTVDRWVCYQSTAGTLTIQQSTDAPTGFTNSLKVTTAVAKTTAASDYFNVQQPIEGYNVADLAWGSAGAATVTLSFWVKSSLSGTFGGCLQGGSTYSDVFQYTINASNTWEYKTVTITGSTAGTWGKTNGTGIVALFSLGDGSNYSTASASTWVNGDYRNLNSNVRVSANAGATFYITGVQLEKGATATPFENRLYGTELALCQRYYYKAITGTLFNQLAFCNIKTTTSHYAFLQLPVTMRANPSSVDYSGLGVIASWGSGVTGLTSLSLANVNYGASTTQVLLDAVTTGAVGTVGQISMLLGNNNASGYVALNAEL